ncbi:MAG: RNA 2',3'-cyclic phosphodiesterase [Frankiaceae bacterium]
MRLFVAIHPSAEAAAHLDAALEPVRADWPGLRWAPVDQWHLTLGFLGEVGERLVGPLSERLGRAAARTPALELSLTSLGAFPAARRARACWAGVAGAVGPLRELADRVGAAARRTGIEMDGKPYRPHLTLARPRRPPQDVTALAERLSGYAGPAWTATELRLVRSHLGAQVRHETLRRWSLGTAGSQPGD